jgi:hypothetical protein
VGEEGGRMGGMRGGLRGIGGGMTSPTHQMLNKCAAKSPGNPGKHTNPGFLGGGLMGGVCIGLESDRAGSRTL